MSDQFPTEAHSSSLLPGQPHFGDHNPTTQLSGYFGPACVDGESYNPFSSVGSSALPAQGLGRPPPIAGPHLDGVGRMASTDISPQTQISSDPKQSISQVFAGEKRGSGGMKPGVFFTQPGLSNTTSPTAGFFDSLPSQSQGQQNHSSFPPFKKSVSASITEQSHEGSLQQPSVGLSSRSVEQLHATAPPTAGGSMGVTSGLFGSSTQQGDFFSSLSTQPMPGLGGKSPSAPPTGLIQVLPPAEQQPSSLPSTAELQVLRPPEPSASAPETPLSAPDTALYGHPSLSSGYPSMTSSHPSLSSGQPSLPLDPQPQAYGNAVAMSGSDEYLHSNAGSAAHPGLSSLDRQSNAESTLSSPLSRPPSNADTHARATSYGGEQPFLCNYQKLTNADNPCNPRGLKTNLQSELNSRKTEDNSTPCPPADAQSAPPPPVSGEGVEKLASERPLSTTSSLNQSLCSLLDSQEDFTSGASPVRLLAPAPFMHEPHPPAPSMYEPHLPVGPPTSLIGEVQLGGALSLVPPAPLPSVGSVTSSGMSGGMGRIMLASAGSDSTSTTLLQEPFLSQHKQQDQVMSGAGTERLLAEASAEETVGQRGVRAGTDSVSPLVVGGSKASSTGPSLSPDSGSKGGGSSLNDWEIVSEADAGVQAVSGSHSAAAGLMEDPLHQLPPWQPAHSLPPPDTSTVPPPPQPASSQPPPLATDTVTSLPYLQGSSHFVQPPPPASGTATSLPPLQPYLQSTQPPPEAGTVPSVPLSAAGPVSGRLADAGPPPMSLATAVSYSQLVPPHSLQSQLPHVSQASASAPLLAPPTAEPTFSSTGGQSPLAIAPALATTSFTSTPTTRVAGLLQHSPEDLSSTCGSNKTLTNDMVTLPHPPQGEGSVGIGAKSLAVDQAPPPAVTPPSSLPTFSVLPDMHMHAQAHDHTLTTSWSVSAANLPPVHPPPLQNPTPHQDPAPLGGQAQAGPVLSGGTLQNPTPLHLQAPSGSQAQAGPVLSGGAEWRHQDTGSSTTGLTGSSLTGANTVTGDTTISTVSILTGYTVTSATGSSVTLTASAATGNIAASAGQATVVSPQFSAVSALPHSSGLPLQQQVSANTGAVTLMSGVEDPPPPAVPPALAPSSTHQAESTSGSAQWPQIPSAAPINCSHVTAQSESLLTSQPAPVGVGGPPPGSGVVTATPQSSFKPITPATSNLLQEKENLPPPAAQDNARDEVGPEVVQKSDPAGPLPPEQLSEDPLPKTRYEDYPEQRGVAREGYPQPYHDPYHRDTRYSYEDRYRTPVEPYHHHSRPHSRATYGYPHDPHHPPYGLPLDHPPYHHPPPPGRGRYDPYAPYPPYRDPYHHHPPPPPHDPYHYPYAYEYDSRGASAMPYHRYPPDPHHDYHPPGVGGGYPPYDSDPRYESDRLHRDSQYPYSEYSQDPEGYHSEQTAEVDMTSDPSIIYGPSGGTFEESQVLESPDTRLPAHAKDIPLESTYLEYPAPPPQQPQFAGEQYVEQPDGQHYQQDFQEAHPDYSQHYPNGYNTYQKDPGTSYYQYDNVNQEQWQEQQQLQPATPPPPARETPEIFSCPHVRASFCFGGQLLTVLPANVSAGQPALVELTSLRDLLQDQESRDFVEAVMESPGPLMPADTPKSSVVSFASKQAQLCRDKRGALIGSDSAAVEQLEDEVLFWEFLVLLCQQNGTVMPSDVADLLMSDRTLSFKSSTHFGAQGEEGALDSLRQLLLAGRRKDALDFACSKSLWGHALMLASRMDEQSRTYVVNRFTASLMTTDPLNTFYTLLLGRTPSSVKPEGLSRAGDWRPHLSIILANKTSKVEAASIVSLGDSLMSRGRRHAAHLCYHLAEVRFGSYGETDARYSLLGVDHTSIKVGTYPQPGDLQKTEVFEYAMSLTKQEFNLPGFQVFKLLHLYKLVEHGFLKRALKYCEQLGGFVLKGPSKYLPTFLSSLVNTSVRLHHVTSEFACMEAELPSWLYQLQQAVSELSCVDYTPNLLSPSPAFSSVSQTYSSASAQHPRLIIGLQQDSAHLAVPRMSTFTSSKSREGVAGKEGEAVPTEGVKTGDTPGGGDTGAGLYRDQDNMPPAGAMQVGVASSGQEQLQTQDMLLTSSEPQYTQEMPSQSTQGQLLQGTAPQSSRPQVVQEMAPQGAGELWPQQEQFVGNAGFAQVGDTGGQELSAAGYYHTSQQGQDAVAVRGATEGISTQPGMSTQPGIGQMGEGANVNYYYGQQQPGKHPSILH